MKLGDSAVVLPANVVSVPVPLMAEVPDQLNVPETLTSPPPVRVPPDTFRVVSDKLLFARPSVPPPSVSVVRPENTVPVLNVRLLVLSMLVRLANAVPSPLLMPPKLSVVVPLLATRLVPTLVTAPVKLAVVVPLICVDPLTL